MAESGEKNLFRRYGAPTLLLGLFAWVLYNLQLLHLPASASQSPEGTDRLFQWLKYCLFPFVLAWFILARRGKHNLS